MGLTNVAFAQPWWISGGTTGTLVYNTSLAESLGFLKGAVQGQGRDLLDYGWMAVVEGGQAYVLDGLDAQYASSTIHIRAIPAAGVYGTGFQFGTTVANNVLLWEGQIAAVASTAERGSSFGEFDGNRGGNNSNSAQTINGKGGRFLVSGLNLFNSAATTPWLNAEPVSDFAFERLVSYAVSETAAGRTVASPTKRKEGQANTRPSTLAAAPTTATTTATTPSSVTGCNVTGSFCAVSDCPLFTRVCPDFCPPLKVCQISRYFP